MDIDHGLGSFANSSTETTTTTSKPNYTPFVGMQFETEEEAFDLYNNYGGAVGFSVKKHYRNKSKKDGVLTSRKFCCCKEGVKVPDKRDRETRKQRAETRTDCPAYMVISLNREINKFVVTKLGTSHNHPLHLPECTYLMPSQRRITVSHGINVKMSSDCGILLKSSHELMSAQAGGSECLGFTPVDQNNYLQGKRQRDLKYGEVGSLLEYFHTQSAQNPAFYHRVQLDAFEQVTNFFWADPKMILDYANFGDVVSFDTTYRTNKEYRPFGCFVGFNQFRELVIFGAALLYDETTSSFEWLLKTFFNAMSGKKPLTIFTDEDQAMAKAISIVMPDSCHGLCTWHLMQNALKHLGYLFKEGSDFSSDFNACIYKYKEESKLLEAWEKLLNDYKLHENTWIESKWQVREKWAIAYMMKTFSAGIRSTQLSESLNSDLKDYLQPDHDIAKFLIQFERAVKDKRGKEIESEYDARQKLPKLEFKIPMLKQVASIYTPSIFKKFQKQHTTFLSSIVKQTYEVGGEVQYVVGLYDHEAEYIVSTDSSKEMVFCGCRKFERVGILCSHALKVLDMMNIKLLPEHYILRRWTRDARTDFQQNANVVEDGNDPNLLVSSRYRELCPKLVQIASLGSEDNVAYQLVSQVTTDLCKELEKMAISRLAVGDCNNKGKSIIEDTCEEIDKFALVDLDLMQAKGLKKRDSGYKGWGRPKSRNEKSRKRKAAPSKPTEPPKAKDDETPRSIQWNTQGQNALAHAYTNSLSHSQPSNLSYGPSNMTYYPQQLTINDVQTAAIGSSPFFMTDNFFDFLGSEVNGLSKDVQKLLWKNNMKFPKADAKLKALGLLEKGYSKKKIVDEEEEANQTVSNGSHTNDENGSKVASDTANIEEHSPKVPEVEDSVEGTFVTDLHRPSKKAKPVIDGNCCNGEVDMAVLEGDSEKSCMQTEVEVITDNVVTDADASLKVHPREKKLIDFREKLYLAPLTTAGNLPFRRVCKVLGADVTCGEMAMCTNLLQGQASEWDLLRRHSSEDLFGVQICGAYPDTVARTVELIDQECTVDFIDINMGCPIDIVVNKGAGSALILKPMHMKNIIEAASSIVEKPITVKVRTGYLEGRNLVDSFIEDIGRWGASALTIHGRSRQQRYSKLADWEYIYQCTRKAPEALQVLGNGDVFSYLDWNKHKSGCPELSTCVIARGALVKPWIFTEIKEQRHWDISSGERLNIFRDFVRCGLQHWGSDSKGVETTRHFLLEWLSYTYRYVPVGLLDVIPQRLNWRPPSYFGRDDLETLMASDSAADWVRISEMLLGKVPDGFNFAPKHKSNVYDQVENGHSWCEDDAGHISYLVMLDQMPTEVRALLADVLNAGDLDSEAYIRLVLKCQLEVVIRLLKSKLLAILDRSTLQCARKVPDALQVLGNGDVFSYFQTGTSTNLTVLSFLCA